MADTVKPTYLVDAYADPVLIRIDGRASFQNSTSLRDFISEMIRQGKRRLVIDFQQCTSMDSTFLGVLAGAALELRKQQPAGSLVLARLSPRNLELVRNLGLHRLLTIDAGEAPLNLSSASATPLAKSPEMTEIEHARLVLEAHENLITANEGNQSKFQDVLTFLRSRIQQG
ncbi:STAS domain protein [mine drainage metagenome]|uniref:STAS domain protein n=1 Tax=mine drainage metagenome TaxID=410659 RepID=A0A1J5SY33_9ZZZZ